MTATMLAARLDPATRHFAVTRVPVPEPADDEVRVAVRAAGVCLSDLHLIDGTLPVTGGPLTLGHEVAGVVDKVGAKVPSAVSAGQRVLARQRAIDYGADLAVDPAADCVAQILAAVGGGGLDFAFDFAGAPAAREQALASLSRRGSVTVR